MLDWLLIVICIFALGLVGCRGVDRLTGTEEEKTFWIERHRQGVVSEYTEEPNQYRRRVGEKELEAKGIEVNPGEKAKFKLVRVK